MTKHEIKLNILLSKKITTQIIMMEIHKNHIVVQMFLGEYLYRLSE